MKLLTLGLLASLSFAVPAVRADEYTDRFEGSYSGDQLNFVTVKRLSFTEEKDGSMKVHGFLVGFPDEVSIGQATPVPYVERDNKKFPTSMLLTFSAEKYKPLMIIRPQGWERNGQVPHATMISFDCYMRDVDGTNIHLSGSLHRDK
jgi:hypothetical protein